MLPLTLINSYITYSPPLISDISLFFTQLKQFIMNIQEIKVAIAANTGKPLTSLVMVRQLDQNTDAPTEWLSHWDNDNRIRVTMHEDVFNQIQANPTKQGFAFKKEVVSATPDRAEYTRFVVITPKNVEGTF